MNPVHAEGHAVRNTHPFAGGPHRRSSLFPLHEPTVRNPGFSRSGPPEGGTPNKWRPTHGFMVPTRAQKRMGAFHEPAGSGTGVPPVSSATRARRPRQGCGLKSALLNPMAVGPGRGCLEAVEVAFGQCLQAEARGPSATNKWAMQGPRLTRKVLLLLPRTLRHILGP